MFQEEEEWIGKQGRIAMEILRLFHTLRRHMDGLAEQDGQPGPGCERGRGISGTNIFIIAYLYQNRDKDIFQKDLEENMNVRRSTISKVLGIMEQKNLIRREQVECDGRLRKIVLTQETLEGIQRWKGNSKRLEGRVTRGFTEEELDQFHYLLNKAQKNFEE